MKVMTFNTQHCKNYVEGHVDFEIMAKAIKSHTEHTVLGYNRTKQVLYAALEDGTIAGSAVCLAEMVRRAVSFGVPMEKAIRAATANTAQAAGLWDAVGSLAVGKCADVLVMDEGLHPEKIFLRGKEL